MASFQNSGRESGISSMSERRICLSTQSKSMEAKEVVANSYRNFDAVCIASPCEVEGEKKDQDRFSWDADHLLACVCDGLTESPFASEAAAHVVATLSPD